jgi:hypothetical protein
LGRSGSASRSANRSRTRARYSGGT